MPLMQCKTCRHWKHPDDEYDPITDPQDDDGEYMQMPFQVRQCRSPKLLFSERPLEKNGFAVADASNYKAWLYTAENFGCVLHEKVPRLFRLGDVRIDSFPPHTAVRVTHIPTGKTVTCDTYRSRSRNQREALIELEKQAWRTHKETTMLDICQVACDFDSSTELHSGEATTASPTVANAWEEWLGQYVHDYQEVKELLADWLTTHDPKAVSSCGSSTVAWVEWNDGCCYGLSDYGHAWRIPLHVSAPAFPEIEYINNTD